RHLPLDAGRRAGGAARHGAVRGHGQEAGQQLDADGHARAGDVPDRPAHAGGRQLPGEGAAGGAAAGAATQRRVVRLDRPGGRGPLEDAGPPGTVDPAQATAPPRVRSYFPETLLWKPELITDDQGVLPPLSIHLADSITTWRLSASAVSADGRLGATQRPMKV